MPKLEDIARLGVALVELPPHTLWAVGCMEEGPFARLVLPHPNGGYSGGYREAFADTPADAVRAALASVDTHPKDGDVKQAPLVSGAVAESETPNPDNPMPDSTPMMTHDELVETLFAAIKHGDEEHQAWLQDAIAAHFAGQPVPAPRGNGTKERAIEQMREEIAGRQWRPIETAPCEERVMLWCEDNRNNPRAVAFGRVVDFGDGDRKAYGEGVGGDWLFTHWMPLPLPPIAETKE